MNIDNKWIRGALPAFLIHISIGMVYAWSMLVEPIAAYINQPQSKVQFAFSLAIFFLGLSAAFGGKVVEKNISKSSLMSLICFCGGLLVTAIAVYLKSLFLIYLGYGCLTGIGIGLGYITPIKTLMLWFKDQKGLATGIAVCSFGLASAVASPLITVLLETISLPKSFIALAIIYSIPMWIAHNLIKKPEWYKEDIVNNYFNIKTLLHNSQFILIWITFFLNITAGLSLISIASSLLKTSLSNISLIPMCISIMGIFNGGGRLIFSAMSDKLKYRSAIYIFITLISLLSIVEAFIIPQAISIPIILIIISACYGAGFSCLPSLLSDIFGIDNISKIHGVSLTAWAAAGLVGNQISNLIYNLTGNYLSLFYVLIVIYLIEFILSIIIHWRIKEK